MKYSAVSFVHSIFIFRILLLARVNHSPPHNIVSSKIIVKTQNIEIKSKIKFTASTGVNIYIFFVGGVIDDDGGNDSQSHKQSKSSLISSCQTSNLIVFLYFLSTH